MNGWSLAFGTLQTIMVFALAWFIRLLILFRKDIAGMEVRITALEKAQAVTEERYKNLKEKITTGFKHIEKWLEKIDKKLEA